MPSKNILLVEDNEINQKLATEVLERADYQVTIANHGEEALEYLHKESFSVVLMDLKMPIMDGYEAISLIRQNPALEKQIVVCVSAVVQPQEVDHILASGFDFHLGKPLDFGELYSLLEKIVCNEPLSKTELSSISTDFSNSDNSEVVMNLDAALKSHAGDNALLSRLLSEFINYYSTVDLDIADMASKGQWVEAERMSHNIKSVAGSFGAESLRGWAAKLEKAFNTTSGIPKDYADLLSKFSEALKKFLLEVNQFVEKN